MKAIYPQKAAPTLCGAAAIFEDSAWDGPVLMNRLGGTVKLGDIHLELSMKDDVVAALADLIQKNRRANRIVFGFSVYGGTPAGHQRLEKVAIGLKRELISRGDSVRWVTSEGGQQLSPAAVAKMHLTDEGYDIVVLLHGETMSIGLTTHVQDADAWGLRDYGRPHRDDENGMLPPKLARMMVNLSRVHDGATLIDPFCGSGTVTMEAGVSTDIEHLIASDNEQKQVTATDENITWLFNKHLLRPDDRARFQTFVSDARTLSKHIKPKTIDAVVTEGYLGPPLTGHETTQTLEDNAEQIAALWKETLDALHPLLKDHGRVVCVWPSFKSSHGVARVDVTDSILLEKKYRFVNALAGWDDSNQPILYHRPGQRVMRRIVVLEKA